MGVNVSLFSGDTIGIGEPLIPLQALVSVNVASHIMATCNIIFWSVVVPVALYGCELWLLTSEHIQLLETFQNYACKKIQRFHPRIPNACCMHSRGWIRLERFIQIKKLLFIRSIIAMDGEDVVKIVFMERFRAIKNSGGTDVDSFDDSIVFDLLGTASPFNLSEEVLNM